MVRWKTYEGNRIIMPARLDGSHARLSAQNIGFRRPAELNPAGLVLGRASHRFGQLDVIDPAEPTPGMHVRGLVPAALKNRRPGIQLIITRLAAEKRVKGTGRQPADEVVKFLPQQALEHLVRERRVRV